MVESSTFVLYFFLGPIGLFLTYLKYGIATQIGNLATPFGLYLASGTGTILWATVAAAIGSLVN